MHTFQIIIIIKNIEQGIQWVTILGTANITVSFQTLLLISMEKTMRFHLCFGVFFLTACTTEKEVENNVAPEFTNLWLEPTDGITTSTQLYCVANAIDGNDDPILLDYTWRNSAGEIVSDTWDFTLSPELVQPTEELTCTATISDEEFTVEQSISVTVENTAPEILSMAVSPDTRT